MTRTLLVAGALAPVTATPTIAQQTQVVEQAQVPDSGGAAERTVALIKSGKKLETVSCADFVGVDAGFYPQAVAYAANYGRKGKAHPTVTVEGVEAVVPTVVDACKARPGDRFTQTVKMALAQQGK